MDYPSNRCLSPVDNSSHRLQPVSSFSRLPYLIKRPQTAAATGKSPLLLASPRK